MEDGAFLAKCIGAVAQGSLSLPDAISLYEQERMPKAFMKQQVSFLNGAIWHLPDGPKQQARDAAMAPELEGKYLVRSSNLYGDPQTVLEVYGYDAEAHAEEALARYLNNRKDVTHPVTGIVPSVEKKYVGWFTSLPESMPQARL
jgi:salicylate hydroxylase